MGISGFATLLLHQTCSKKPPLTQGKESRAHGFKLNNLDTKDTQDMTQRTPPHTAMADTFSAVSNAQTASAATQAKPPSVGIDTAYYQSFLDDYDIPEAQKRELIESLWAIIVQFIDLGFGVHPITAVQNQRQCDETLRALKAVARDFASDAFDSDPAIDPVLIEELVIADNAGSSPTHTQNDTQTERSET
jgi:hypothetical protein